MIYRNCDGTFKYFSQISIKKNIITKIKKVLFKVVK